MWFQFVLKESWRLIFNLGVTVLIKVGNNSIWCICNICLNWEGELEVGFYSFSIPGGMLTLRNAETSFNVPPGVIRK